MDILSPTKNCEKSFLRTITLSKTLLKNYLLLFLEIVISLTGAVKYLTIKLLLLSIARVINCTVLVKYVTLILLLISIKTVS